MTMKYSSLIGDKTVSGSIKAWTNYVRVDSVAVLEEAQSLLFDGFEFGGSRSIPLRVREMRATATVELALGATETDLPERYLDPLTLRDITTPLPKLELWSADRMFRTRAYDGSEIVPGLPTAYAVFDEKLQFNFAAEQLLTYAFLFYQRPLTLSEEYETNFLTERFPRAVRLAACMVAADYMHDDANYARYARDLLSYLTSMTRADDLSMRGATFEIEVP